MDYQSGFANEFATEAVQGALPAGQNAPQKHPLGLYTEQLSGTAFTAPRALNRRTWTYRIRPSVTHKPFEEMPRGLVRGGPFDEVGTPPSQRGCGPLPLPPGADGLCGWADHHGRKRTPRRSGGCGDPYLCGEP